MDHQERNHFCLPDESGFFQLYSLVGELYCVAVIFCLRRVYCASRSFGGEYNITLRHRRKKITVPQGQYNCRAEAISLTIRPVGALCSDLQDSSFASWAFRRRNDDNALCSQLREYIALYRLLLPIRPFKSHKMRLFYKKRTTRVRFVKCICTK